MRNFQYILLQFFHCFFHRFFLVSLKECHEAFVMGFLQELLQDSTRHSSEDFDRIYLSIPRNGIFSRNPTKITIDTPSGTSSRIDSKVLLEIYLGISLGTSSVISLVISLRIFPKIALRIFQVPSGI